MVSVDKLCFECSDSHEWKAVKDALRNKLSEFAYNTWVENLNLFSIQGKVALLGPVSAFTLGWLEKNYSKIFLEEFVKQGFPVERINYVLQSSADAPKATLPPEKTSFSAKITNIAGSLANERQRDLRSLDARYTFASFVCGDCNSMASSAARAVAESPRNNSLNPLIIYGGSGLGKTHLMHAIGHFALETGTANRVLYCSAERFLRDYMNQVVQGKDPTGFRENYESSEILLIDDIQFLARAERTQEELFKLLSRFKHQGKQIVVSSDMLPSLVQGMHRKLLSQFEAGICCSIEPPGLKTRLEILRKKAKECPGLEMLPEEILRYIANYSRRSIREMEGTLLRLFAHKELLAGSLDLDTVRGLLGDAAKDSMRPVSVQAIAEAVALEFGISVELLGAATRQQAVMLPRKVAMLLCRELTDASLEFIGLHFHRDYSTVLHAVRSLEQSLAENPNLASKISFLRQSLAN